VATQSWWAGSILVKPAVTSCWSRAVLPVGGYDAHDGAVGDHHEPNVAVRRAERAEHAKRAKPPLGHHREAGHGHETDEDQPERGEGEHDDCGADPRGGRRGSLGCRTARETERRDARRRRVEQDRHLGRRADLLRCHQRELVQQVRGILNQTDDAPGVAVLVPEVTDPQVEQGRHLVAHPDLVRTGRVAARDEGEHRLPVGAAWVLGAQFHGVDRAGGELLVGGGAVWSMTRPSRRNTTRSAHEASCASWVTTTAATPACTRRAPGASPPPR
jgi:hypothetical protein